MNREQTEDLKAFEQRLMDCVAHVKRKSFKWKVLIVIVLAWFLAAMYTWWMDATDYVRSLSFLTETLNSTLVNDNYYDMFSSNVNLCTSTTILFLVYLLGFFDRQTAASIITNRCRLVLHDFNMSCDHHGKLILKRSKLTHDPWKHS